MYMILQLLIKVNFFMKKLLMSLILILIATFVLFNVYNLFNETKISDFEPFSKNNILLKQEQSIKIKENLPNIEAASAFYPFSANLVQNIYSENAYSSEVLKMVSTSQAYSDIIDGKIDIIIATEPSDEQKEMIKDSNVELEYKAIYLEPLVIFVNKKNSIENLSIEQIQEIYYGSKPRWNEFSVNLNDINTYQLEKNNGSQTCFESIVKNNKIGKNHYEVNTMPKIIDNVALDKNGIGYAFYSYYSKMYKNNKTKIINVNDKEIEESDYPLLFEVYLIYRTDNSNENISKIVNWLETNEGKEFIKNVK